MYSWENGVTSERYETPSLKLLVYIIRRAYREYGYNLPRGIRIMKDGQLYWALWYEDYAINDIGHVMESETMRKQSAFALRRLALLGERLMIEREEDLYYNASFNMPCDTYGMGACSDSCPRYHECYGCK